MQKKNLLTYLSFAHYVTDKATEILINNYKSKSFFSSKKKVASAYELVTDIDSQIENTVRKHIIKRFPEHNILGEELGEVNSNSDFTWIIDPIDGTKAFVSGIPVFTFLLSLKYKNNYILGVIDQPLLKERYWNFNNKAYLNKKIIKTRKCQSFPTATIAITEPEMFPDFNKINNNIFTKFNFIRWGTDALGYMRCAEGIIDGVIERNMKIWDLAAIEPIINNAGGIISTWDGKKIGSNDTVCASGDKKLHNLMVNSLQNYI